MPAKKIKKLVSGTLKKFGYEIRRSQIPEVNENELKLAFYFDYEAGTQNRPIGDINTFLNDIKQRGYECRYVFDIGSNRTDYSRMIRKVFPDADFLLIDPLEEMESYMKDFCSEFKGSEYIVTGVGSKNEKQILTTSGDSFEGSTMMLKEIPSYRRNNKQREVEVVTVDSIINNRPGKIPDFVKIDVQGFELEVLKGSETLFGATNIFIIEVSLFKFNVLTPDIVEIINFMSERGYTIYDIPGFIRRPYDGALAQLDLCFVKNESLFKDTIKWSK